MPLVRCFIRAIGYFCLVILTASAMASSQPTDAGANASGDISFNVDVGVGVDVDVDVEKNWQTIEQQGKNQAVYFHAWGGDPQINRYIQWLGQQVKQQYNIDLHHVKLSNTSEAVSRVLAEKSADNHTNGQVDLVWINGENFAAMAKHRLLTPNWVEQLPNFALTNPEQNPAMTRDFGLPTQGMEAPWGQAALTFYYTPVLPLVGTAENSTPINTVKSATSTIYSPPQNIEQLIIWSQKNPGRFAYPKPPDFLALSFLKYALITLNQQQPENIKTLLYEQPTQHSQAILLPVLWRYLDKLHPNLWRKGQYFVASGEALKRLMGDGEINLAFTFSAATVPAAVDRYDLPPSTRSYVMQDGSLSNIHFVAIPYNAAHSAAAQLVANVMLSIQAQAKKQQVNVWGDNTVIDLSVLSAAEQALFSTTKQHPSALPLSSKITALSEPHPGWSKVLTGAWLKRYGAK